MECTAKDRPRALDKRRFGRTISKKKVVVECNGRGGGDEQQQYNLCCTQHGDVLSDSVSLADDIVSPAAEIAGSTASPDPP